MLTSSVQNCIGIFVSIMIDLTLVLIFCIIRSTTPFMFCVWGGDASKVIPFSVSIFLDVWLSYYLVPLSYLKRCTLKGAY